MVDEGLSGARTSSAHRAYKQYRTMGRIRSAQEGEGGVTMTERTLYERLGGVDAIALVVDRFSDQIVTNPKLNVNPALKDWNEKGNLPSLKFLRTLWICAENGGTFTTRAGSWAKPTRTCISLRKSSTRLERRSAVRLTTSMCPSRKSRKFWVR